MSYAEGLMRGGALGLVGPSSLAACWVMYRWMNGVSVGALGLAVMFALALGLGMYFTGLRMHHANRDS